MPHHLTKEDRADSIDALINAATPTGLMQSLQSLEDQFRLGIVLDEDYYRRKAQLQEAIQLEQEKARVALKQKKKELRYKYEQDQVARQQLQQQEQMKQQMAQQYQQQQQKQAAMIQPTAILPGVTSSSSSSSSSSSTSVPTPSVAAAPVSEAAAPKPKQTMDDIFANTVSSKSTLARPGGSSSGSGSSSGGSYASHRATINMGTIKFDPSNPNFDPQAYKQMMIQKYEEQQRDEEYKRRIAALGDPTSPTFNHDEYKRLMIERYDHQQRVGH
jgi:hypothetical protein